MTNTIKSTDSIFGSTSLRALILGFRVTKMLVHYFNNFTPKRIIKLKVLKFDIHDILQIYLDVYDFPRDKSTLWESVPKSRFIVHPHFHYHFKPNTFDNDIAIVKLNRSHEIATFPCLAGDDSETFVGNKTIGTIC